MQGFAMQSGMNQLNSGSINPAAIVTPTESSGSISNSTIRQPTTPMRPQVQIPMKTSGGTFA